MKNQDATDCTFVNTVVGRGVLNNVINLSFSTFNFTPTDDGKVDIDPVVSCRLRMDKACAMQLRDVMNDLIAQIEKAEQDAVMGAAEAPSDGIMPKQRPENIN